MDAPADMDPLSAVLAFTNAHCEVSGSLTAGGEWAVRFPQPDHLKVLAVVRGSCWFIADPTEQPTLLRTGEAVITDGSFPFVLASSPAAGNPRDLDGSTPNVTAGTGDAVLVVGVHVGLTRAGEEILLGVLPRWLHLDAADAAGRSIRLLTEEVARELAEQSSGMDFATDQLARLVFLHALRAAMRTPESVRPNWLQAIANPRLVAALRLIHGRPDHPWRLEDLAHAAAMSRTSFATSFRHATGTTPLAYLTDWRMSVAARQLTEADTPLPEIAASVGYRSPSAFSNAFKRATGVAPTHFRAQQQHSRAEKV